MCFSLVSGVLIAVHGEQPPSSAEWRRYLNECETKSHEVRANLVVTLGGGPTPAQRAELSKLSNLMSFPTAVVSASLVVRGIVTAIGWSGKRIRAFSPADIELAFGYLGLAPETKVKARLAIAAMKDELRHA